MSMALTAPPTRKRFLIVACLFIGIFIAYLDRVNVSVLAANEPFLAYMGIEGMPLQIGMMMTVFLAAYVSLTLYYHRLVIISAPEKQ